MTSSGERTPTPYGVQYPEYGDVDSRVKSFTGWPGRVVGQDARVMAVCGLFYIGSADRVRCFSCGTTLRNWQPHNDPLEVHLRVAPHCSFIRAITKNHAPGNAEAGPTSGGNASQGPPRAGVKDGSAGGKGGSSQVVRGSTGSAISGLDRGSFGPAVQGSAGSLASGSGREGSSPNGRTPTTGVTSGLAKTSVGHSVPGSSTIAASSLSSRGSLPQVQGSSASGVARGSLGPSVRGPVTRMTSGMDRGGQAVVPPTVPAALTASGDLCEDCSSGPAAASTSFLNRGNNSRRQDSNSVTSLGQELSSPAVLAVLEMGVPRHAVEAVLRDRKSRGLQAPPTAVELYMACQDRTT